MKLLVSILALLFVIACSNGEKPVLDLSNMDAGTAPGQNFFQHVNGTWLNNTKIPENESSLGVSSDLKDYNKKMLHDILEELIEEDNPERSNAYKVATIYKTGMDTARIEQQGIQPLQEMFNKIESIETPKDVQRVFAEMSKSGTSAFYSVRVDGDLKQSDIYTIYVSQGGLAMPDRDYYLEESEKFNNYRTEYAEHLQKMFVLAGDDEDTAKKNAGIVMRLETEIAEASWPAEKLYWTKMYNKRTLEEAYNEAWGIDWSLYFRTSGIDNIEYFIMAQPDFFVKLGEMIWSVDMEDWKIYLKWHVINSAAPYLSRKFRDQHLYFFSTVLNDVKKQKPRWKTIVETADDLVGEALGQLYVEKHFPPEAKVKMNELVDNLLKAFSIRLKNIDWMSEETKKTAFAKLERLTVKLGCPDKWRDYSKLDIRDDAYVLNVMRAKKFDFERQINKIGKPVDKSQWSMSPQTVAAYYHPLINEIVFPAGILQPPMFNLNADDAVNYGAIGAVVGHEIIHGYDDLGRGFNAEGNLVYWWNDEESRIFRERVGIVEKQFNSYTVLDSVNINGLVTLRENIAELGGIAIAYDALQTALKEKGRPDKIDGYTPEQRFFISYASIWRNKSTDEDLLNHVKTKNFPPSQLRVLGTLSNTTPFFDAFDIKEGENMRRPDSLLAKIW